jgi:excisionase family DNA binding protein
MEKLLTTQEAADLLGVSPQFLERARWSGAPPIPFVKVGARAVRYDPVALESYKKSRIRTSTSNTQAEQNHQAME